MKKSSHDRWMGTVARSIALLTASVSAIGAAAATAQSSSTGADQPAAASTGEIVVTAQRRSESIQDVPVSVISVGSQQIEDQNLRSINDIQLVTPGLVFDTGYAYPQVYIRGIGSDLVSPGLENAVAIYIDGVYQTRTFGSLAALFDLQSVQVLRGPQGTLYGRNATGGAILLTTADPTDSDTLRLAMEYGRFDHVLGEAVANVRLTDTLALRVALQGSQDQGYIRNRFDGSRFGGSSSYVARGKLRWAPGDDFTAIFTYEHNEKDDRPGASVMRLGAPICILCGAEPGVVTPVDNFYEADQDVNEVFSTRADLANLHLTYQAGDISLSSTTGYRKEATNNPGIDQDFTRLGVFTYAVDVGGKSFTQDFQAASDFGGAINGLIGASYLDDKGFITANITGSQFDPLIQAFGEGPNTRNRVRSRSLSLFGELYVAPIEGLKITLGGRYTHDRRRLNVAINAASQAGFAPPGSPAIFTQRVKFNSFTPRFVIAYDTGSLNLYASYNRGFKAGGFGTPVFSPTNEVAPEKIDSYELGAKFVSPDRRFRANLALFTYDYRGIQRNIVTNTTTGGLTTQNAAKGRGRGVELDTQFEIAQGLSVLAGGAYLRARYKSYDDGVVYVPQAVGLFPQPADLSGQPLSRAPKWTGYLTANLEQPVTDDIAGRLSASVRYTSAYDFWPGRGGPLRYDFQPGMALVNMTGSLKSQSADLEVGFYINNLTGKKYYIQRFSQSFGAFDTVAQPRTFGIRLVKNFGQ